MNIYQVWRIIGEKNFYFDDYDVERQLESEIYLGVFSSASGNTFNHYWLTYMSLHVSAQAITSTVPRDVSNRKSHDPVSLSCMRSNGFDDWTTETSSPNETGNMYSHLA